MRIGVNALFMIPGGVGGTEIYLRNLLTALATVDPANDYFVFTNRETDAGLVPPQSNFRRLPQAVRASFRPARILWEQTALPLAAKRHRLDVMLNPGFTCPLWTPCPHVTVFHDLQHKRHPEHFRWFDLPFWQFLLWAAARRSKGLIAVSEATQADLTFFYRVDSVVIHHGVEPAFFNVAHERKPGNYLLCVSTLHPHKNLDRLIRVFTTTPHAQAQDLVITGLRGFAALELEKLAGEGVRFTGWVPREELYDLFRGARAFIYPSKFEGFGMPVLEAMAARVPVACSDIRPLREIADGCAFFFDPNDDGQMRDALRRVQEDDTLVGGAQKRAGEFTWENTARATLAYLAHCASR